MIYIRENYSKRLKIISISAAETYDLLCRCARACVCVCLCVTVCCVFLFFLFSLHALGNSWKLANAAANQEEAPQARVCSFSECAAQMLRDVLIAGGRPRGVAAVSFIFRTLKSDARVRDSARESAGLLVGPFGDQSG